MRWQPGDTGLILSLLAPAYASAHSPETSGHLGAVQPAAANFTYHNRGNTDMFHAGSFPSNYLRASPTYFPYKVIQEDIPSSLLEHSI